MANPTRFTMNEMLTLAETGRRKVDLLGARGTTLVSMDELEAMALVMSHTGAVERVKDAISGENKGEGQ